MHEQWACPDLGKKRPEGFYNLIPGSPTDFDDCPAYYLRQAAMDMPAEHLIDGITHPANLVGQWAFEIESGARQIESLSSKAIDAVHLWFTEKRARDVFEGELRKKKGR
jgi:hypothetical protein